MEVVLSQFRLQVSSVELFSFAGTGRTLNFVTTVDFIPLIPVLLLYVVTHFVDELDGHLVFFLEAFSDLSSVLNPIELAVYFRELASPVLFVLVGFVAFLCRFQD